jgi:RHS repeat-associated protein
VGSGSPAVKGHYRYDPFGRPLASGGALAAANALRFSSKPVFGSSGLYYYGFRFYDPGIQRWLNRDPLGDLGSLASSRRIRYMAGMPWEGWYGPNIYEFAWNSPTRFADTDGRWTIPLPGVGGEDFSFDDPVSCANRIKNEVWENHCKGDTKPAGDSSCHEAHCITNCRIARECPGGRATAGAASWAKEIKDQFIKWFGGGGDGFSDGDMQANRAGRRKARECPEKSCEEACKGVRF